MRVTHSESMVMWGVAILRSGEEGLKLVGRRVGESLLRCIRSEFVRESLMSVPRSQRKNPNANEVTLRHKTEATVTDSASVIYSTEGLKWFN